MKLKELKKGEYFRIVSPSGLMSRETYIKGDYDRSEKKYLCARCSDLYGSRRYMRSNQEVKKTYIVMFLIKSPKSGLYGWHFMKANGENKREAIKAVRQAVKDIFNCHAFRRYAGKGEKVVAK